MNRFNDKGIILSNSEIKQLRLKYNLSQYQLAMLCNISREYLNKIENNIKVASDDVMMKVSLILHRYLKYKPLDIIIDYLRVRFPTCDIKYIVHKVLGLKIQYLYEIITT